MADSSQSGYAAVSIGATAAVVKAAFFRRESILIQNVHASQVLYLGSDASVTTSNGLKVLAGESVRLMTKGDVYGIASGASTDVRYFEEF